MNKAHDVRPCPIAYRSYDAAKMLGVSLSHLQRMTKAGEIPYVNIGGIKVYPDGVLREWMRKKARCGVPESRNAPEP